MENEQQEFTLNGGILAKLETKEGTSGSGKAWKRGGLTIEKGGKSYNASTFDEKVIELGLKSIGKIVNLKFTSKGKFNNLIDKSFAVVDQGEQVEQSAVVKEEVVGNAQKKETQTNPPKPINSYQTKEGYWQDKFEFEKVTYKQKQIAIIKQSCDKLAMEYVKVLISAVEQGVLTKQEVDENDLDFKNIIKMSDTRTEEIIKCLNL